jgi:hypothetical protein
MDRRCLTTLSKTMPERCGVVCHGDPMTALQTLTELVHHDDPYRNAPDNLHRFMRWISGEGAEA